MIKYRSNANDMNLAQKWRQIVTENGKKPFSEELDRLNNAIGTKTINSRFNEWEKGDRSPTLPTIKFMLHEVIKHELGDIDKKRVSKLLNILDF